MAVELGSAAIFAYLICLLAVALVFLCFTEIGGHVSLNGGAYAYVEDACGPFAGFIASMLFWFGWCALSDAAIAVAMVEGIAIAVPSLAHPFARSVFIVAVLPTLAAVNIVGVRSGVRLMIFNVDVDNLTVAQWPPLENVGAAAIILFFTCRLRAAWSWAGCCGK